MSQKPPKCNILMIIVISVLLIANVMIARQKLDESFVYEDTKIAEWKRQNYISPADQVVIELTTNEVEK